MEPGGLGGMQLVMPLFNEEYTLITGELGYQKRDGVIYYFHGGLPLFRHAADDRRSFDMISSQFVVNGTCREVDLIQAFGIAPIRIKRAVRQCREQGPGSFFVDRRGGKKSHVMTDEVIAEAERLLAGGAGRSAVAKELGIHPDTLRKAIGSGRVNAVKKKNF
jgi:hypothetical protein